MLHIAEFKNLLLHFLFGGRQLLSLVVELALHIVDIGIQCSDGLFQIMNFLILQHHFIIYEVVELSCFLELVANAREL